MFKLTIYPGAAISLFTSLCLSQVKEQLPENLVYFNTNPESFIWNGELYVHTHNQTIIDLDLQPGHGLHLKFNIAYN